LVVSKGLIAPVGTGRKKSPSRRRWIAATLNAVGEVPCDHALAYGRSIETATQRDCHTVMSRVGNSVWQIDDDANERSVVSCRAGGTASFQR
jgi:hypothetical protein